MSCKKKQIVRIRWQKSGPVFRNCQSSRRGRTPFQKELRSCWNTQNSFARRARLGNRNWLSRHHANGLVKLLSELFMRSSSTLLYFLISSNKIALKAGTGPTAASNYLLYRLQLSEQMVHIVVVIVVDLNCR